MSRTWKDDIKQRHHAHRDAPYWKYDWWMKHGDAETRRLHNRSFRRKVRQAVYNDREPPKWVRDLPWIWW